MIASQPRSVRMMVDGTFEEIVMLCKEIPTAYRNSGTTHGGRLSTFGDRLPTHCDELTVAQGSSWGTLRVRPSRRYSKTAMHVEPGGRACNDLTLSHVLEDKKLLSRFAAFLENEHSIENLRFHESASAFLDARGKRCDARGWIVKERRRGRARQPFRQAGCRRRGQSARCAARGVGGRRAQL